MNIGGIEYPDDQYTEEQLAAHAQAVSREGLETRLRDMHSLLVSALQTAEAEPQAEATRRARVRLIGQSLDLRLQELAAAPDDQLGNFIVYVDGNYTAVAAESDLLAVYCEYIDTEVGKVRALLVSNGDYVEEEYRLAYEEAKAWVDAGSPAGSVPLSVQVWANSDYEGDNEAAALNVIETRERFNQVLNGLREVRLQGKADIKNAVNPSDRDSAYHQALVKLASIRALAA